MTADRGGWNRLSLPHVFHPVLRAFLGLSSAAMVAVSLPAQQPALTSIQALHALDNSQASREIPAEFEATVVYSRGYQRLLFVQEHELAIFVNTPDGKTYTPGDRLRILGKTTASFRPMVTASSITVIEHGKLPPAVSASFGQLIRGELDSRLVKVNARVRAADVVSSRSGTPVESGRLQLTTPGGRFEAYVDNDDQTSLKSLLDADVEITGAAAGKFDDKMQQTGVILYVSKLSDVRVVKPARVNPWSLPATPVDKILAGFKIDDLSSRVRVIGTITYYQPGSAVVLQTGSKSLWISTRSREPLRVGDVATAIGFPTSHDRVLSLVDAEVKDVGIQAPLPPHPATYDQLALWDSSKPIGYQYDLVSTEGKLIAQVRGALEDEYVLSASGHVFSALFRHPRGPASIPAMRMLPLGSQIRVTGICAISDTNLITPGEEVPFDILVRTFDDIEVIAQPSLLDVRHLVGLVGILFILLFVAGLRALVDEKRIRRQTANLAYVERKRAHILADINGQRPLSEIIEDITQMVSSRLRGSPCWCQIDGGALIGNEPRDRAPFRIAEQTIVGRSGSHLGTISAALDRRTKEQRDEIQTLSTAASVAALAIETRRLYSDLVHRSEFDQLTEIHNRFSFEKAVDEQILATKERAGLLGIIYIDLDDFKKVNDTYGHLAGDMYLTEVALRMKRQLRGHDMLGRVGGDEFAVLLPLVHARKEVEEIAQRLKRSFAEPFQLDVCVISGSASIGYSLFPQDGTSKDELVSAADAAMYVAKQRHKNQASTDAR